MFGREIVSVRRAVGGEARGQDGLRTRDAARPRQTPGRGGRRTAGPAYPARLDGRRAMRYALLLYMDPARASAATAAEAQRELSTYAAITEDLARQGVLQGGEAFLPEAMARFVGDSDERQAGGKDLELSGF